MGWLGSIVTAVWILVDVVYSCMGLVIQELFNCFQGNITILRGKS